MCTLTAELTPERFCLTMNRDESRERAEEAPPCISAPPHLPQLLAPRDGGAGGTWIGVNDQGVVGCLLNLYDDGSEPKPPSGTATRGELVEFALRGSSRTDAVRAFRDTCVPTRYSPFRLVIFGVTPADDESAAREVGTLFVWRGNGALEELPLGEEWTFLTSSSWNPLEVLPWRESEFRAWREGGAERRGLLPTFHVSQPKDREAWAPLLSREKTSTRSITQVEIDRATGKISMRYWSRPTPDASTPTLEVELPRGHRVPRKLA